MRQIIIRMFVALIMCAVTSVIRFTSFIVISSRLQVRAESVWIARLILASILSPFLYSSLNKLTAGWSIRARHKPYPPTNRSIL
jgi:hypothetical protein